MAFTSRQRIALAAGAAGIKLSWDDYIPKKIMTRGGSVYSVAWNPMESWADAFELMCRANVVVKPEDHQVTAVKGVQSSTVAVSDMVDKQLATQLAIVEACTLAADLNAVMIEYQDIFPQ